MNKGMFNLQDAILNHLRKEQIVTQIYLTNGVQLRGVVKGFDNFTVALELNGKCQLVYKHAIASIVPLSPIPDLYSQAIKAETQAEEEQ